jgi:hypothetical protein
MKIVSQNHLTRPISLGINFILKIWWSRVASRKYQESGRYEDHSQAIWMDGQIREFMDEHIQDYLTFRTTDVDDILSAVEETLS